MKYNNFYLREIQSKITFLNCFSSVIKTFYDEQHMLFFRQGIKILIIFVLNLKKILKYYKY